MSRARLIACLVLAIAALAYLRDPGWLAGYTTGLRDWQRAPDGRRFRWSGAHASFFVPADAGEIRVPIATTFTPGERPMTVTFTIDDARAARTLLIDPGWQTIPLALPRPGSRRVRRIDVRTDVTREGNHGIMLGDVEPGRQ
jgi:hypothetical protein